MAGKPTTGQPPKSRRSRKSKVVSFWPGIAPPAPVVQPDLVGCLDFLLKAAKSGELQAIAYATVAVADGIGAGWVGQVDQHKIISAVRILDGRVMQAYLDGDD